MDVYVPGGDPGPLGRACVIWLHGGFWRTGVASRAQFEQGGRSGFRDVVMKELGAVFINAEYNLVQQDILIADNTGASHPYPVLDMRTLMKWIEANAEDYRIDITKVVVCGESAGGHVAIETVVTQGNTATFTGYQNAANNRGAMPGNTAPNFDFDRNITTTPFAGAFGWVAPIELDAAAQALPEPYNTAINIGRTGYLGGKQGQNPSYTSGNTDELCINRYIAGTGRVYTTTHEPSKPIGMCFGENDEVVPRTYGVDAMATACQTSGFTYHVPAEEVISRTGLSRHKARGKTHENTMADPDGWVFFREWMKQSVLGQDKTTHPNPVVS